MNHINQPNDIEWDAWLAQYDFSQLSEAQQAVVRAEMGEAEYMRLRQVLLTTQAHLQSSANDPQPRPELRALLQRKLQAQKEKRQIQSIRKTGFPLQIAAVLLLLALGFHVGLKQIDPNGARHQVPGMITDSTTQDSILRPDWDSGEDSATAILSQLDD